MAGLSPEMLAYARTLIHTHDDWATPAPGFLTGRDGQPISVWRQRCRQCDAIQTSGAALDAMARRLTPHSLQKD